MRLIDADKLIEICDKGWRLGGAINTKIYHTVDASDIRSQPTVNAIPVEWILNKYRGKWEKAEMKRRDFRFIEVIDELLADWEKENETD